MKEGVAGAAAAIKTCLDTRSFTTNTLMTASTTGKGKLKPSILLLSFFRGATLQAAIAGVFARAL